MELTAAELRREQISYYRLEKSIEFDKNDDMDVFQRTYALKWDGKLYKKAMLSLTLSLNSR